MRHKAVTKEGDVGVLNGNRLKEARMSIAAYINNI
jgi:hypothetical protein